MIRTGRIFLSVVLVATVAMVAGAADHQKTVIFQNGLNGYSGTHDTYIQTGAPDQNNDYMNHNELKFWELEWDGSDSGGRNFSMFKFPDMFGDGENQIPLGATIVSAHLQTMVINDGSRDETDTVYRLLKDWDETTVTYNNYFDNFPANQATNQNPVDSGYLAPDPVTGAHHIPNTAGSAYTLELTKIVQEWSNGADNFGFIITVDVGGGNGFGHVSSEASQLTREFIDDLIAQGVDVDGDLRDPAFPGFDQNIRPTLVAETADKTYTFQYGENEYYSYDDASIVRTNPNLPEDGGVNALFNYPLGNEGSLRMDMSDDGSFAIYSLCRFRDIFGDGPYQIPYGTEITNGTIRFFCVDDGPAVQVHELQPFTGKSTVSGYEDVNIETDWVEEEVTYANLIQDGQFPAYGGEITNDSPIGQFTPDTEFRFVEADVTITLNKYSNQTLENYGWMIEHFGGSDVSFVGKEGANVFGAPALTVVYETEEADIQDFMLY
ncbi:DNRLRE domain-containing protein [bacterium]|nr:DNRLRE domain-containing protein [bacterium]